MLQLMAGATGAGLLSACAAGVPQPVAQQGAAAAQAGAVDSVIPLAASGGLPGEVVLAIMAGPESDAHVRLAPKFAKATGDTLAVRVEQIGRDVWPSTSLTNFQSKSDAWDAVLVRSDDFKLDGPAGFVIPLDDFMADPALKT